MKNNAVEMVMGGVVIAVAGFFLIFAYRFSDIQTTDGYELTAAFSNAGGLATGSDVRVSGVKVGSVTDIDLNEQTYQAIVSLSLKSDVEIPIDSVARISSDGLLGDTFLALEIGAEMDMFRPGERIEFTQANPDLLQLIGQAIYSFTDGDDGNSGDSSSGSNSP